MVALAESLNYGLAALTDVNCVFVHKDDFGKLQISDSSIEAHYNALWSGRDNIWVPLTASDCNGNYYLLRGLHGMAARSLLFEPKRSCVNLLTIRCRTLASLPCLC